MNKQMIKSDVLKRTSIKEKDLSLGLNAASNWVVNQPQKNNSTPNHHSKEEHLIPWALNTFKSGLQAIPKQIKSLSIYAGIILAVNLIFWTIKPYLLPSFLQPFKGLISTIVFLTATYNDVVPKTIFWVIVFTFGKRLVRQVLNRGIKKTFACMKLTLPNFFDAISKLSSRALPAIFAGIGFGLIIANNFASYSRFSSARNKFDKYFIIIVIAFVISYMLGEANKTGIFKFVKLASKDLMTLFKQPAGLSDDGVYLLLSGFVIGLLLDWPLILFKWLYGGYIMGGISLAIAIGLYLNGILSPQKRGDH